MFQTIQDSVLKVDPEDVLERARRHSLQVKIVEDFRKFGHEYSLIKKMMDDYHSSFTFYSSVGGLTAGIGGFTTAVALTGIDMASEAIQLYRLAQRFAILNGFKDENPLHRDEMMNIYFEALGISGATQTVWKDQFLKASLKAGSGKASESLMLKLIIRAAKIMGKEMSFRKAGRLIPVFGGIIGVTVNRTFAEVTGNRLKIAYQNAYFKNWHQSLDQPASNS